MKTIIDEHTRIVDLTSMGNPIGMMTIETFKEIMRIVGEKEREYNHPIIIIVDTIYEAFRMDRTQRLEPLVEAITCEREGPVIEVTSISKMMGFADDSVGWAAIYWPEDCFHDERRDFFKALDSIIQPRLRMASGLMQAALYNLYYRISCEAPGPDGTASEKELYVRFKETKRKSTNELMVKFARMMVGIEGVVLHQSYFTNGEIDPNKFNTPYVFWGIDQKLMQRYTLSQARRLAERGFMMGNRLRVGKAVRNGDIFEEDILTPVFTPGDNFLASDVRGKDPQEYIRTVALMTDDEMKNTVVVTKDLIEHLSRLRR
jgi:hypothetical protein